MGTFYNTGFLIAFEKKRTFLSILYLACFVHIHQACVTFVLHHMKQTALCSSGLFRMQLVRLPWQPMLVASKLERSPVGGSNGVADKVNVLYAVV